MVRFAYGCIWVCAAICAVAAAEEPVDVFGVQKFYATKAGTISWTSEHWANGHARALADWSGDAEDPLEWTDDRSSDAGGFYVDGAGVMQMKGSGPRFHINSQQSWAEQKQFFRDVEFTAYFKRDALGGENYGGMVMGVRSGALGHGSSGGDNCEANTYYARFRNDGNWDFEKEWKHPGSYYQSEGVVGLQSPLWNGAMLPVDRWIGMKFIVYNVSEDAVHLEVYIDSTSGGNPESNSGGVWHLVGSAEDDGKTWSGASGGAAAIEGCSYTDALAPILEGGGIALMRSDNDNPYYKYVTLREIDPSVRLDVSTTSIRGLRPAKKAVSNPKKNGFDLLGRSVPHLTH